MLLVTGGAGFIGSTFVRDWLARHDEPVLTLDALTYAGDRANLAPLDDDPRHTFVHGDIADHTLVARLLAAHRPRAIMHFAAETHVDRSISGPEAFVQANVVGTVHLLEAARAYHDGLASGERAAFRFVHVSTDEVYGALGPDDAPVAEGAPYAPNSPYAASKAAADHFVRAWHRTYGLPVITTHCTNNYGPAQFPEKLIPLVIARALAGAPIPVYGDGRQVRDWLYVHDHATALRRVLEAGAVGAVYHIGGQDERENLDVVRALCALLDARHPRPDGRSYAAQIAFVADRPGHDRRYALDGARIAAELGWRPTTPFEEGLRATVQWALERAGVR